MPSKNDSLEKRMKSYESISKTFLTRRIPVIIRLDGKAFHTFTRGMKKPFDNILMQTMQETMKYLCENIQGCVLGYTQSDEITLVLKDYEKINTDAWFGYNVQKMTSISASMATLAFNKYFEENIRILDEILFTGDLEDCIDFDYNYREILNNKLHKAMFDSRVFSIPKDEVCNCLIWRQQDATRNSIEAVGQANFSQKELQKKNLNQIQEMLFSQANINWNDFPTECKRGSCCYKRQVEKEIIIPKTKEVKKINRNEWYIDKEIPIFTQNREYIEKWL